MAIQILLIVGLVFFIMFTGVVVFGAPYLPTLKKQVDDAIDLLELSSGQTMLELGCGDGRLLLAAAKRGIKGVGYELNPILVLYAKIKCWKYKQIISINWGNYWSKSWPRADGMYVFLLQSYMNKLHKKVIQYADGREFKVVSFAFEIKDKEPQKVVNGMFLYEYDKKDI